MDKSVSRLIARVRQLAVAPGHTHTALPDLWLFRADTSSTYVRGYSPTMNVALATSGRKTIRTGGYTQTSDAENYLVMHGSRYYQADVEASPDAPYVALKIQLQPDLVGPVLLELAELGGLKNKAFCPPPPAYIGQVDEPLADTVCRLLDCLESPIEQRLIAPQIFREIAYRLLCSDAASVLRSSITREHLRVFQAMRFIEENVAEQVTVRDIAQSVAMSPSNFAHRFREVASISPIQYLKKVRLEKARLLLLDENQTVDVAAEKAGYASASHFSQDFTRQFGVSPAQYSRTFIRRTLAAGD